MSKPKNKKTQSKTQEVSFKFTKVDWIVISFLLVLIIVFAFWFSRHTIQNFSLQPLQTSPIYAYPIKPSRDVSHQEGFGITGELNGQLLLNNPTSGNFDLVLTSLGINEVIITSREFDNEQSVDVLYRRPLEIGSVLSTTIKSATINLGAFPVNVDLRSFASNFEFTYDSNAYTKSEKTITFDDVQTETFPTKGGLFLFLEQSTSSMEIEGFTSKTVSTGDETLNSVYVVYLDGVKQIAVGNELLTTPEKIALVLASDVFFAFRIDSNFTQLENFPADNNLINAKILAPVIKVEKPSGNLTLGTERRELSEGLGDVTIKAVDEYLEVKIKSEKDFYEAVITGETNSIVINGIEVVSTRWQALSDEWRSTLLGTFFAGIVIFVAQKFYQYLKKEKA